MMCSTTPEVSQHIHTDSPNHTITSEDTKILSVEQIWFERGVKEVIHIRTLKPSLTETEDDTTCPPIWINIIKERMMERGPGTTTGGEARAEEFW